MMFTALVTIHCNPAWPEFETKVCPQIPTQVHPHTNCIPLVAAAIQHAHTIPPTMYIYICNVLLTATLFLDTITYFLPTVWSV